jgi:hypothetical protein
VNGGVEGTRCGQRHFLSGWAARGVGRRPWGHGQGRAGGIGVKRGFDDGQRRGLGDGPSVGFSMAPAKRRAPAEASQEMKGQVGTGEGPAGWVGAHDRLLEGLCIQRGTGDLAVQARGESSNGVFVETHGQTGQEPYRSGVGACDASGWDGRIGLGSGMREEDKDAVNGAVEVDVGILLELASRAGIQLEDVVAMTRAQLTLGFLPTGILPTAGSASRVAILDAPPTTVMGAQALDVEVRSAQQSASGQKEVSWAMIWEAEVQAAHGAQKPTAMGMPNNEELGEPGEASRLSAALRI